MQTRVFSLRWGGGRGLKGLDGALTRTKDHEEEVDHVNYVDHGHGTDAAWPSQK